MVVINWLTYSSGSDGWPENWSNCHHSGNFIGTDIDVKTVGVENVGLLMTILAPVSEFSHLQRVNYWVRGHLNWTSFFFGLSSVVFHGAVFVNGCCSLASACFDEHDLSFETAAWVFSSTFTPDWGPKLIFRAFTISRFRYSASETTH